MTPMTVSLRDWKNGNVLNSNREKKGKSLRRKDIKFSLGHVEFKMPTGLLEV